MRPTSSEIPAELVQAYLATDYRVLDEAPFSLRIGQYSRELLELYGRLRVDTAQFLTAWNPLSQLLSDTENELAQGRLVAEVERHGLAHLPGKGVDLAGEWPGEPSLLILGINSEAADALGRAFRQYAFV
jgi:hypothetical protein